MFHITWETHSLSLLDSIDLRNSHNMVELLTLSSKHNILKTEAKRTGNILPVDIWSDHLEFCVQSFMTQSTVNVSRI